ncbi:MAG: hypothetical protein CL902_01130 [Dehalococcoidia bacterium]|nr:hypothetical protein [Dehalococcoidia bacterium]
MPREYDEAKRQWKVSGVYCSFACVQRAICELRTYKADEMMMWLHDMASGVFGTHEIGPMAPSKSLLRVYGGSLSVEEFRESMVRTVSCIDGNLISYPQLTDGGVTNQIRGIRRPTSPGNRQIRKEKVGLGKGAYANFCQRGKDEEDKKDDGADAAPEKPPEKTEASKASNKRKVRRRRSNQTTLVDLLVQSPGD